MFFTGKNGYLSVIMGTIFWSVGSMNAASAARSTPLSPAVVGKFQARLFNVIEARGDISSILSFFTKNNVDISKMSHDASDINPVQAAAMFGAHEALKLLLNTPTFLHDGSMSHYATELLSNALFTRATTLETIQYLVEKQKADVKAIIDFGQGRNSLLMQAVANDYDIEIIKYLVGQGLDPYESLDGQSAFAIAQRKKMNKVVTYFKSLKKPLTEKSTPTDATPVPASVGAAQPSKNLPHVERKEPSSVSMSDSKEKAEKTSIVRLQEIRRKSPLAHKKIHALRAQENILIAQRIQEDAKKARQQEIEAAAQRKAERANPEEDSENINPNIPLGVKGHLKKALPAPAKKLEHPFMEKGDEKRGMPSSSLDKESQKEKEREACVARLVSSALEHATRELREERAQEDAKAAREKELEAAAQRKTERAVLDEYKEQGAFDQELERRRLQMEGRAHTPSYEADVVYSLEEARAHFLKKYGEFTDKHKQYVRAQVTKKWIYQAVLDNNLFEFHRLMAVPGATVDFNNDEGISLLQCAVDASHPAMVEAILYNIVPYTYWQNNSADDIYLYAFLKGNKDIMHILHHHLAPFARSISH